MRCKNSPVSTGVAVLMQFLVSLGSKHAGCTRRLASPRLAGWAQTAPTTSAKGTFRVGSHSCVKRIAVPGRQGAGVRTCHEAGVAGGARVGRPILHRPEPLALQAFLVMREAQLLAHGQEELVHGARATGCRARTPSWSSPPATFTRVSGHAWVHGALQRCDGAGRHRQPAMTCMHTELVAAPP